VAGVLSIAVVGAGALGSACAALLTARGARVALFDASGTRPNASTISAGMIAPAFEAVLENATTERAELHRIAAAAWPRFAASFGLELFRDGAEWVGPADELAERFRSLGFRCERSGRGLFTDEDARLDPADALARLSSAVAARIGAHVDALSLEPGGVGLRWSGEHVRFDAVVLATGWSDEGMTLEGPGERTVRGMLDRVSPIRGQIVSVGGAAVARPIRAPGVYLTPGRGAVRVGATMDPGRSDLAPDPDATRRLLLAADPILPGLADMAADRITVAVGIRGASPDGAPLAGRTPVPRLFTALAPRRNGWLFAPIVAETVARAVFEEAPGPVDRLLSPDRFNHPASVGVGR
jgi:glycine oxidase